MALADKDSARSSPPSHPAAAGSMAGPDQHSTQLLSHCLVPLLHIFTLSGCEQHAHVAALLIRWEA